MSNENRLKLTFTESEQIKFKNEHEPNFFQSLQVISYEPQRQQDTFQKPILKRVS